jgi:hypothetical protein
MLSLVLGGHTGWGEQQQQPTPLSQQQGSHGG